MQTDIAYTYEANKNGEQWVADFPNGFSVSIVRNIYSYGYHQALYELAVFKYHEFHYDNPVVQGDVRGYITWEEANQLAEEVREFLPNQRWAVDNNDNG